MAPLRPTSLLAAALLAALAACAPALDWREVKPEASGVALWLPCKPDRFERTVEVAGARTTMRMWSCRADGRTFSIAWLDAASAEAVAPALLQLRATGAANLGAASSPPPRARRVSGETPNAASGWARVDGRGPGGDAISASTLLFARGLRVYQASVLGTPLAPADEETFFESIRAAS